MKRCVWRLLLVAAIIGLSILPAALVDGAFLPPRQAQQAGHYAMQATGGFSYVPISGDIPLNFTATYVNAQEVALTWSLNPDWDSVEIRFAYGRYPGAPTEGFLVYAGSGTSCSDTGLDLNRTIADAYYSAWSVDLLGNYSPAYAAAMVVNPAMDEMATALASGAAGMQTSVDAFTAMFSALGVVIVELVVLVVLMSLALWKKSAELYIISGIVAVFLAIQWIRPGTSWFYIGIISLFISLIMFLRGAFELKKR